MRFTTKGELKEQLEKIEGISDDIKIYAYDGQGFRRIPYLQYYPPDKYHGEACLVFSTVKPKPSLEPRNQKGER